MLGDQITTGSDIYLVRVVSQDGEVDYGWSFRFGIVGHKIPQGSHRLGAEMASFDDVIVHDLAHSSWLGFSGGPVDKVNHSAKDNGIGHFFRVGDPLHRRMVQYILEDVRVTPKGFAELCFGLTR